MIFRTQCFRGFFVQDFCRNNIGTYRDYPAPELGSYLRGITIGRDNNVIRPQGTATGLQLPAGSAFLDFLDLCMGTYGDLVSPFHRIEQTAEIQGRMQMPSLVRQQSAMIIMAANPMPDGNFVENPGMNTRWPGANGQFLFHPRQMFSGTGKLEKTGGTPLTVNFFLLNNGFNQLQALIGGDDHFIEMTFCRQ